VVEVGVEREARALVVVQMEAREEAVLAQTSAVDASGGR
jgi:hypothetical protein